MNIRKQIMIWSSLKIKRTRQKIPLTFPSLSDSKPCGKFKWTRKIRIPWETKCWLRLQTFLESTKTLLHKQKVATYIYIMLIWTDSDFSFKTCDFVFGTTAIFQQRLKCANNFAIRKKDELFDKRNHRPVSTLPLVSKVYEKVIQEQISNYFKYFVN